MNSYVATKQFRGVGLSGDYLVIHFGQALDEHEGVLYWQGKAVCLVDSVNGSKHFSWDGDGRGKERGALTYALAYGDGGQSWAFSESEKDLMRNKWGRYLRSLSDTNIVNAEFFLAPVETLEQIAKDLHFVRRKNRYYYNGAGPEKSTGGDMDDRGSIGWSGGSAF